MSIGSASRIGASDGSLILTSSRKGRHERQLRRALAGDGHGNLGTQAWGVPAETAKRVRHRAAGRYHYVNEEVPAVWSGSDILNEQIIQAIIGIPICEREIQRPLYLPAELQCLPLSLPTGGQTARTGPVQGLGEIPVHER